MTFVFSLLFIRWVSACLSSFTFVSNQRQIKYVNFCFKLTVKAPTLKLEKQNIYLPHSQPRVLLIRTTNLLGYGNETEQNGL